MGLGEAAKAVAAQALTFEEFLAREAKAGRFAPPLSPAARPIKVHGHCHQKAFGVMQPALEVLKLIPGAKPELIESSCCGMAGSFGYEAEHHAVSMQMAELSLLPQCARRRRLDRGRRRELPPPDRRRCAARGAARGACAGRPSHGAGPRLTGNNPNPSTQGFT